jgi:iron complex transport system ATP-binding protein
MRLSARDITVVRGGSTLLDDVSLEVKPGEVVSILGPNGAGKSTLLGAMMGRIGFDGRVDIDKKPLDAWTIEQLARRRAILAQSVRVPFGFRVDETVRLGALPWAKTKNPVPESAIAACLNAVGMAEFTHRQMNTLSGGEQRRVHLARTLAQLRWSLDDVAGRILMLDEPLSSLDIAESTRVLGLIREASRAGLGIACVLHDLSSAALVSDRVLLLRDGRTVASGPVDETMRPDILSRCFGTPIDVTPSQAGHALIHSSDIEFCDKPNPRRTHD